MFILKRAGGGCEPVDKACESLLEQGTEYLMLMRLVSTFG